MLGTGHGKALKCYNYCFLLKFNNTNLLVDSGGGNQIINQLKKANIKIEDIDNVFISHSHMDHILGLIWMIRFLCPKYYNGLIDKQNFELSNLKITVFDSRAKNINEFGFVAKYANKRIIYLGDERYSKINKKYINNCDYAFMDARDINNDITSAHSTVKYSATIAQKYHIKNLILSHCNDFDLKNRKTMFKNEASKYYNGNIFVPYDLEEISIE